MIRPDESTEQGRNTMEELLELVENNKESMNNAAYVNLLTGLQELYNRTNGTFTTDYRQMYLETQKELELIELMTGHSGLLWTYEYGIGMGYKRDNHGKWFKHVEDQPNMPSPGYTIRTIYYAPAKIWKIICFDDHGNELKEEIHEEP